MDNAAEAITNTISGLPNIDLNQPISEAIQKIDLSQYADILNPSTWQTASVESFLVVFLVLVVCYKTFHKAYRFAGWCLGILLLIQLFYCFGQTSLNNIIPFSEVFKYDIGVSIAGFFPGTKFAEWLLYIHDLLAVAGVYAGNMIGEWLPKIFTFAEDLKDETQAAISDPSSVSSNFSLPIS